jgi:signal-transduction protein with cAMP-binding, CBS, and nucleotidyltransferase domain
MLVEEVSEFLKKSPAFQFLDVPTLKDITDDVTMEFYPKGTVQRRGVPAPEHLLVIEKDEK